MTLAGCTRIAHAAGRRLLAADAEEGGTVGGGNGENQCRRCRADILPARVSQICGLLNLIRSDAAGPGEHKVGSLQDCVGDDGSGRINA